MALAPRELVLSLRSLLDDTVQEYLWCTSDLVNYINQAYNEFAKETHVLSDQTTADVAVYSVSAASEFIALSEKVIKIRRAASSLVSRDIGVRNANEFPLNGYPIGVTSNVITDKEKDKVFFYPIPSEDFMLTLSVFRRPLEDFSLNMSSPLEIDDPRHWDTILTYARGLAYLKDDPDTADITKGQYYKDKALGEMKEFKGEVSVRTRTPGLVSYGGL